MHQLERRFHGGPEAELTLRMDTGKPGVRGYAATYGTLSDMVQGMFREELAPGAFSLALGRSPDVRCTINHLPSAVIGRSKSGTLELRNTSKGLMFDVPTLPDTTAGRDLAESLRRGDIDQCSFAFRNAQDSWREQIVDGQPVVIRTLHDLELVDVSVVTYPVYPGTEVGIRSAEESLKRWVMTQSKRGKSIQISVLELLEKLL